MKLTSLSLLAIIGISTPALAWDTESSTIEWDEHRATSSGTKIFDNGSPVPACPKFDPWRPEAGGVQFLANGDTISVLFTGATLNLGSYNTSGRTNCRVVIPARVAKGIYFAELVEQVTYGIVKSKGASGKLAINSRFAGYNVNYRPIVVDFPRGRELNKPYEFIENVTDWSVHTGRFCGARGSAINVNYVADFVLQGIKDTWNDSLVMSVDGLDLRFESTLDLQKCPL